MTGRRRIALVAVLTLTAFACSMRTPQRDDFTAQEAAITDAALTLESARAAGVVDPSTFKSLYHQLQLAEGAVLIAESAYEAGDLESAAALLETSRLQLRAVTRALAQILGTLTATATPTRTSTVRPTVTSTVRPTVTCTAASPTAIPPHQGGQGAF